MAYLRRMRAGFVLGMTPGMVGFIVAAVFWASGTGHLTVLVVVVMPPVFAAIGGVLGVMVNALFVYVRLRTRQPITGSKRSASAAGLAVGTVPGVNGLIFTMLFWGPGCWMTELGSLLRLDCQGLMNLYFLVFASVAAIGGLVGFVVGGVLGFVRSRRGVGRD